MLLNPQDARDFLDSYMSLIARTSGSVPKSSNDWADARDHLFSKMEKGAPLLPGDDEIIESVKNAILGRFFFLKCYKDHSAMLYFEDRRFYAVMELTNPLDRLVKEFSVVDTCLLPYRGKIVCDGLVRHFGTTLRKSQISELRDVYQRCRRSGKLIWQLPVA